MDSITHIVLGATTGEILGGKKIGKKAMLLGAAANSLPDIDFIAGLWMSPSSYFLAHRGLTHSFLFIVVASPLISLMVNRISSLKISFKYWCLFFFIQLLIHILLDSLNAYGVGWFEPFSHLRISYDVLFVVDPFFTIWLILSCGALLIFRVQSPARVKCAGIGIMASLAYIGYAGGNKLIINNAVDKSIEYQKVVPSKILTTPTPLNSWLWYVVAEVNKGYYIGYHSVFDHEPVVYHYFARNDSLLDDVRNKDETRQLTQLARDFYVIEKRNDTLVFSNLRFGQINGWENTQAKFIFNYNLEKPNNLLMVQQGRFSGWNDRKVKAFIKRIAGN